MTSASDNSAPAQNGQVWAAILAAAIGCFAMGVIIDLAEAFTGISKALNLYNPTGDLSGKSSLGVLIWLCAWGVLHILWKDRTIHSPGKIFTLTIALLLLAMLAVFPPFFGLFAAA
jgi:hypothetical protein